MMLAVFVAAFALPNAPFDSVGAGINQLLRPDRLLHLAAPLSGVWSVDAGASDSLSGFLRACGVPRAVAPLLAKKFDGDDLVIDVTLGDGGAVSLSTPRSGWFLPVKLQTDAAYAPGQDVTLDTPRGPQLGRLCQPAQPSRGSALPLLQVERHGPSDGEVVVESYAILEAPAGEAAGGGHALEQVVTHVEPGGAEVTAVRIWRRKDG